MSPRFAAIADLHLGAGIGYGTTLLGPGSRLADQEAAWLDACRQAITERVDAVLFAGDAFHRSRPPPAELLAFRRGLDELRDAGIPVIAIPGNHDTAGTDQPTALSLFHARGLELSRHPQVFQDDPLLAGVAVATLPWTPTGRLVAARGGGDRDQAHRDAAQILVETAAGLRAQIPISMPAILMAHWSVSGAVDPGGQDVGLFREPVLDVHELAAQRWDAIVLGHIHVPQALDVRNGFYCGSVATVTFGEAEVEHGFWIMELDADRPPMIDCRFHPVAGRPFVTLDADLTSPETSGLAYVDLGLQVPGDEVQGAVVRVRYTATPEQARRVDHAAIRKALLDAGAHQVWKIQPEIIRGDRARAAGVDETLTPLAALDRWITHQQITDPVASSMRGRTETYLTGAAA